MNLKKLESQDIRSISIEPDWCQLCINLTHDTHVHMRKSKLIERTEQLSNIDFPRLRRILIYETSREASFFLSFISKSRSIRLLFKFTQRRDIGLRSNCYDAQFQLRDCQKTSRRLPSASCGQENSLPTRSLPPGTCRPLRHVIRQKNSSILGTNRP